MSFISRKLGNTGEQLAEKFLIKKGFQILFRQKVTPHGEIDLVCLDREEMVFVEVKTRTSDQFGFPEASVTPAKFRHMARAAEYILEQEKWYAKPWRLDVVAIVLRNNQSEIVHFPAIDNGCSY